MNLSGHTNDKDSYSELIIKSGLAEYSAVRGCMTIKPYGFALWEHMRDSLDRRIKQTGHQNVYFPLLIPKSFFNREASHVKGFAKECAVVTHYRLRANEAGEIEVDPHAKLDEELIVRPTSETVIWSTYRNWVQSYRDLPLLFNQWANVMRWEMRTRLFLRTSEFLWQEGHTAHATAEQAIEEAEKMLQVYVDFMENEMAIAVVQGLKTPSERFAGADKTYCVEAMLKDGKALQVGTSHFLGQNFSRAFDVRFLNEKNQQEFVWATSWGTSTRMIGGLVLSHADDKGLQLPPNIAPYQVVIIPVGKVDSVLGEKIDEMHTKLSQASIRVKVDHSDRRPGWKFAEYELQGIPLRITLGPRDVQNNTFELTRRDDGRKTIVRAEELVVRVREQLASIQRDMLLRRRQALQNDTRDADNFEHFRNILDTHGGFVRAHWDGTAETEEKIKEQTKATIRCIPLPENLEKGTCIYSGQPSTQKVLFARAY